MANPRARITNTSRQPLSAPAAAPQPPVDVEDRPRHGSAPKAIGRAHGRKRAVGVYLPAGARERLDQICQQRSYTLADAALWALARLPAPPTVRALRQHGLIPGRARPAIRSKLDRPSVTYLLLEPDQATALKRLAERHLTTVSELVTRALLMDP